METYAPPKYEKFYFRFCVKIEYSGIKVPEESACGNAGMSYGKFLILTEKQ